MNVALRPLSLGEILDRAIQILRANLGLFLGIYLIPGVASLGYSLCTDFARQGPIAGKGLSFFAVIIFAIADLILVCMAQAALCWATSRILLDHSVSVRAAYAEFRGRKARLVWLEIVQSFLSFWPIIPGLILTGAVFGMMAIKFEGGVLSVVTVALMAMCGPLMARYLLAFPATALTGSNVHDSLSRSIELGRGFRWKVFWAYAIPIAIQMCLFGAGAGMADFLSARYGLSGRGPLLWQAAEDLWIFLIKLVFEPIGFIALTLAYYDLCVRKEGLDVSLMMEQAGMTSSDPLVLVAQQGEDQA